MFAVSCFCKNTLKCGRISTVNQYTWLLERNFLNFRVVFLGVFFPLKKGQKLADAVL